MKSFDDLARAIDKAARHGDENSLRRLGKECSKRLNSAKGDDRVILHYYESNTHAAIIDSKYNENYAWSWEQPDSIQNILCLRRAIAESNFESVHPIVQCQIRTNLANRLKSLGRPIAANEQYLKILDIISHFAKTLANRAQCLSYYAHSHYDIEHALFLLSAARSEYEKALNKRAFWESGDREFHAPAIMSEYKEIDSYLCRVNYDHRHIDPNKRSLGSTIQERKYREWCLRERLFLNSLNDICTDSIAATDVLHLPPHTYKIKDKIRFPAYYNLIKQEFVSARFRFYHATHGKYPKFIMRDVLMLDGDESHLLGHYTEDLKSSFRSAYAIFDKIGLFINDYFDVDLNPRRVSFRHVWFTRPGGDHQEIRPVFKNSRNWLLRGLYFLSKDLFDEKFTDISEPDASDLAKLRQQIEHRFLSFQLYPHENDTETHKSISIDDFRNKALRILKMAREALVYISLSMHREEQIRREKAGPDAKLVMPIDALRNSEFQNDIFWDD